MPAAQGGRTDNIRRTQKTGTEERDTGKPEARNKHGGRQKPARNKQASNTQANAEDINKQDTDMADKEFRSLTNSQQAPPRCEERGKHTEKQIENPGKPQRT